MAYTHMGWRNEVGDIVSDQHGLIILGNTGVGKSFLANVLVGKEVFKHASDCDHVTERVEYVKITIDDEIWAIFNIPGLIEADQERIYWNKKEIIKAFTAQPSCVIIYVFGTQNGRIRNEDVVAFHAINQAYQFRKESLAFVVNGVPKDRVADYEGKTITLLRQLVSRELVRTDNVCFLENINTKIKADAEALKQSLMRVVLQCEAQNHVMKQDIKVTMIELQKMEEEINKQRLQFERERKIYFAEIASAQNSLRQAEITHREQMNELKEDIDELRHKYHKLKRRYRRLKDDD